MTTDELLTAQEVAERLRIHVKTVYLYIESGRLQAIKLDGLVRVRASVLEAFLSDRTTPDSKRPL